MSTQKLLLLLLIGISVLGLRDVAASSIVFTSARQGQLGEIRLTDIYVMSFDGGNVKQLTHTPESEGSPTWSPDGKYISTGQLTQLTNHPDHRDSAPHWTRHARSVSSQGN